MYEAYDEIAFRLHQLRMWIELDWWGSRLIDHYPFTCGLVIGVIVGYYAEPFADYCERVAGRRKLRYTLYKRIKERQDEQANKPSD
jgi:hypothetical protein